jgi:hypothetical protein
MLTGATHTKIEEHIRKHRASGGHTASPGWGNESPKKGKDEADEDLKIDPPDRTLPGGKKKQENIGMGAGEKKVSKTQAAKRGGFMKKEVRAEEGHKAHHHSGRKARKSGGHCEANPFTTANVATLPKGRKVERMSEGTDEE